MPTEPTEFTDRELSVATASNFSTITAGKTAAELRHMWRTNSTQLAEQYSADCDSRGLDPFDSTHELYSKFLTDADDQLVLLGLAVCQDRTILDEKERKVMRESGFNVDQLTDGTRNWQVAIGWKDGKTVWNLRPI